MKNIKYLIVAFCLIFCLKNSIAQHKIEFVESKNITALIEKHISYNEKSNTMPGFRLNIFFNSGNNSKSNAFGAKSRFEEKHKNVRAYVVFESPNFKVKVGDFKTRSEARGFQMKIQSEYPNSFIIKDDINPMIMKPSDTEVKSVTSGN